MSTEFHMTHACVEINGKKVGLAFGVQAFQHVNEMNNKGLPLSIEGPIANGRWGEKWSELGIAHILYGGYKNECYLKDKQAEIGFEQFYDLAEDAYFNRDLYKAQVSASMQAYNEAISKNMDKEYLGGHHRGITLN